MCEANAFIKRKDTEELLLESVDVIQPLGGRNWFLKNIFGEQARLTGEIHYISLLSHKIVFTED